MSNCIDTACLCCYEGCDCGKCVLGCIGSSDCLCIRHAFCLAVTGKTRGCGMVTDRNRGEICKIGCCLCDFGLVYPTTLCASAGQTLCCYSVASFPWSKDYVSKPVCAVCFIACCPECGCCVKPPDCPALDKVSRGEMPIPPQAATMERGQETTTTSEAMHLDGSKTVTTTVTDSHGKKDVTNLFVPAPNAPAASIAVVPE